MKKYWGILIILLIIYIVSCEEDLPSVTLETITNNQDDFINISDFTTEDLSLNWLPEAVEDIAYYLRQYKFNEYDRRYSNEPSENTYFSEFPRPPLRSLHWEVQLHCEASFVHCIEYLNKKIKLTGLRRRDDTNFIILDQNWTDSNQEQIKTIDEECQKMRDKDYKLANPFQGPLERFKWRTTASYYLCWYTMNEVPVLENFRQPCDNFAYCLDTKFGPKNSDIRVKDLTIFSCALYSFCPDPCCPIRYISNYSQCYTSKLNPCSNNQNNNVCKVLRSENTDFSSIVLNRWNVSCECTPGYVWQSRFGFCIDLNECATGNHTCNDVSEICVNTQGEYLCSCNWGYIWSELNQGCIESGALEVIKGKFKDKTIEGAKFRFSVKGLFKKIFNSNAAYYKFDRSIGILLISILLFV